MELQRSLQRQFIETAAAKETVLFANTASFLFDRLRKDSSAAYVAHELTAEEILRLLRDRCANADSPMDLLGVYVLMGGLSLKSADDIKKVGEELNRLDFARVQWGDYMRTTILNKVSGPNTNVVEIRYQENKQEYQAQTNVAEGRIVNSGR
jgi:hypothetical protein